MVRSRVESTDPDGMWWEGHFPSVVSLPQAQSNNEKKSDKPAEGQSAYPFPALLQTIGVVQTRKV